MTHVALGRGRRSWIEEVPIVISCPEAPRNTFHIDVEVFSVTG
jgi:hypothetical protein